VYVVASCRDVSGVRVAIRVACVYATFAATATPPGPRSRTVDGVIVADAIASLNVAVTVVAAETPAAPFTGVTLVTVGGVTSAAVVNDQVMSAASALPAASFTPLVPLTTVAE
jgi:hypothetical protein